MATKIEAIEARLAAAQREDEECDCCVHHNSCCGVMDEKDSCQEFYPEYTIFNEIDIADLLAELKRLNKLRELDRELIDKLRAKIQKSQMFSPADNASEITGVAESEEQWVGEITGVAGGEDGD